MHARITALERPRVLEIATALGVGLGAVVRNQAGAIVGALGLLYVVGPLLTLLPVVGDAVAKLGLAGLSSGVSNTPSFHPAAQLLGQIPAALVLAAYAVGLVAAGSVLLRRRDVSA